MKKRITLIFIGAVLLCTSLVLSSCEEASESYLSAYKNKQTDIDTFISAQRTFANLEKDYVAALRLSRNIPEYTAFTKAQLKQKKTQDAFEFAYTQFKQAEEAKNEAEESEYAALTSYETANTAYQAAERAAQETPEYRAFMKIDYSRYEEAEQAYIATPEQSAVEAAFDRATAAKKAYDTAVTIAIAARHVFTHAENTLTDARTSNERAIQNLATVQTEYHATPEYKAYKKITPIRNTALQARNDAAAILKHTYGIDWKTIKWKTNATKKDTTEYTASASAASAPRDHTPEEVAYVHAKMDFIAIDRHYKKAKKHAYATSEYEDYTHQMYIQAEVQQAFEAALERRNEARTAYEGAKQQVYETGQRAQQTQQYHAYSTAQTTGGYTDTYLDALNEAYEDTTAYMIWEHSIAAENTALQTLADAETELDIARNANEAEIAYMKQLEEFYTETKEQKEYSRLKALRNEALQRYNDAKHTY